jgi:sugar lactone lactonase YvrE
MRQARRRICANIRLSRRSGVTGGDLVIDVETRSKIRSLVEHNARVPDNRAPDFGEGFEWLNVSRPLALRRDLRGKIVVVDFWTYCCINCMHVLPDLEFLEEKYRERPLAVVGCHSAKFANEADVDNVREAVRRYRIRHPVVLDEDFRIWRSYGIRGWPGLVVIGPESQVIAVLGGEGNREILDAIVEEALVFFTTQGSAWNLDPLPIRLEAERDVDGPLRYPGKIVAAPHGRSLFVSDSNHDRIVEFGLDGGFRRAIGSGETGRADGALDAASFDRPQGLAFHGASLLVADTENHLVRRVDLERGTVETIAGAGGQGHERLGRFPAREVQLNSPWDLLVRGDDVFVAMAGPHQIWRLDLAAGTIEAWAGDGSERILDGPRERAAFAQPSGLASDGVRLYVADSESSAIRAIDLASGIVTTVAGATDDPRDLFHFGDEDGVGPGRRFQHPLGVHFAQGALWVADSYNHKIKRVDSAARRVETFAGDGTPGADDGEHARFREPSGLCAIGSALYVADTDGHRIRIVDLETRRTRTLELRGVPISRRHAMRAPGAVDGIPDLPGAVRHDEVRATVRPGEGTLDVEILAPAGRTLLAEAPSLFTIEERGDALELEALRGALAHGRTSVRFAATRGESDLRVRALVYHCGDDGTCQVRSVEWPLRVTIAPDGANVVRLRDSANA